MKTWFVTFWLIFCTLPSVGFTEGLPFKLRQQQPNVCKIKSSTGVYLGSGIVLAAAHTVDDDKDGLVDVIFHKGQTLTGKIIKLSKVQDLAYLSLQKPGLLKVRGVPLSVANAKAGDRIWKTGYVRGRGLVWHLGKVLKDRGNGEFSFSPYSVGGQSGGPVFTEDGRLIGNILKSARGRSGTNSTIGATIKTILGNLKVAAVENEDECRIRLLQIFRGNGSCRIGEPCPPQGGIISDNPSEILIDLIPPSETVIDFPTHPDKPTEGNCYEAELKAQRAMAESEKNKNELARQSKRLASLESSLKETQLMLQRTLGMVEVTQKELIIQKRVIEAKSGKLAFRMKLDRFGRVISVEPR